MSYQAKALEYQNAAEELWQSEIYCLLPHASYYSILLRAKGVIAQVGATFQPSCTPDELIGRKQRTLVQEWQQQGRRGFAPGSHEAIMALVADELSRRGVSMNDLQNWRVAFKDFKLLRNLADYHPGLVTRRDAENCINFWDILDQIISQIE